MRYDLIEDREDIRDFKFSHVISPAEAVKLPKTVDLRAKMPPVYDQGNLGSCTSNAGCAYVSYKYSRPFNLFSRLYLYYKERLLENNTAADSGATMRSISKALNKFGVCLEQYMPYIAENYAQAPSAEADKNAAKYKVVSYHSLNTLDEIKQCLALRQMPVLIGMRVYASFESEYTKKTGNMSIPKFNEQFLGNHAVLVAGYYDKSKTDGYLIVRNSWGQDWGDKGYFYMPYKYTALGYAFNYWTLF